MNFGIGLLKDSIIIFGGELTDKHKRKEKFKADRLYTMTFDINSFEMNLHDY
jgi:hypothetical protein